MIKNCLFALLYLWILLPACKDSHRNRNVTIRTGSTIIKGDIDGTLYNDTILYFDLAGNLISKRYFKNGKEEGASINYYSNGRLQAVTNYSDGVENGYNSYYDSMGKCYYKDFYYYGLSVGPIEYLTKGLAPKRYFFVSFENQTLLDIRYSEWKGATDIVTSCIRLSSNFQRADTAQEIIVLLYLMKPPRLSFEYSLLKRSKDSGIDYQHSRVLKADLPFVHLHLPILPAYENYVIGLNIYDSILNKKTVVYKDF